LSRWLLQTSDKTDSDVIPFTHEFLGDMLGVRRSTVSQIVSDFHAAGLLNSHRGKITLLKREELKKKHAHATRFFSGTSTDWFLVPMNRKGFGERRRSSEVGAEMAARRCR
jgi:hypothetical protein